MNLFPRSQQSWSKTGAIGYLPSPKSYALTPDQWLCALEAGPPRDPVTTADPVACGSQRPHSSPGAEGTIVPGGGWWGQWGGSRLRRKECVWRSCPKGSSLQVPTSSPSGPLHDPKPFPPLAPSSLHASLEGGDCRGLGEKPRPNLLALSAEPFLGLGAVQHLGS